MTLPEWAPSRFHLAAFRLIASLRIALAKDEPDARMPLILSFAPGQGKWELRLVSAGWFLTAALISTAAIGRWTGLSSIYLPGEFVLAVPLTFFALTLALWTFGVITFVVKRSRLFGPVDNHTVQSLLYNALILGACGVSTRSGEWIHWVGLTWLSLVGLNLAAWILLFPMRSLVRAMNRRIVEAQRDPVA